LVRTKSVAKYKEFKIKVEEQNVANGKKKVKSFKDLLGWQKGITLVRKAYQVTQAFPDAEKFGLVSQMRRAAVSIPSNIAEGQSRHTRREFIQFLSHSGRFSCRVRNAAHPGC
jgi:hypothetical protein